jgi:hypothetical protein
MAELPVRGFQIHITHYDHEWWQNKDQETPFDLDTGRAIIATMAAAGLNLLVIDCADGVEYGSHPELGRPYTQPMSVLCELVTLARDHGIETVPLLNFAQSGYYHGNDWFRPHNAHLDSKEYWTPAFEVMDELIDVVRPRRFFHIGMDEDHWRSRKQYADAVERLRERINSRVLRTVMWNMSTVGGRVAVCAEKIRAAEPAIARDVVQVMVDWKRNVDVASMHRIVGQGFELWGNPGPELAQNRTMVRALQQNGGQGVLFTRWIPCTKDNREELLGYVRQAGAVSTL